MNDLKHLGGVLANFANEDVRNPQLTPTQVTVYDKETLIFNGRAKDAKEALIDKSNREIVKWEAYFQMVTLTI